MFVVIFGQMVHQVQDGHECCSEFRAGFFFFVHGERLLGMALAVQFLVPLLCARLAVPPTVLRALLPADLVELLSRPTTPCSISESDFTVP